MSNHLVSIVIPYYGQWQLTHARMGEIYKYLPDNIEVVLVNDASPDEDCHTGAGWWQTQTSRFPIKYVRNKENLGFGGSHNRGAKAATGDILVFLSNDVVIGGNFISRIEEIIDDYDGEVLIGGRVFYTDTGWNTLEINGKPAVVTYPEGWLISVTKKMWDRIGGWDVETYGLYDYEDIDLGAWAIYNDVPMVGLNLPFLRHMFGQTIYKVNPDRQKTTERNKIKFQEKWQKLLESKFS